jgi:molecular chaperone GrpE
MIEKKEVAGPETPEADSSDAESKDSEAGMSDEVGQDRDELQTALEEAEAQRNQYLRTAAELENVRRRAQRDVENAHRYGMERFARELLGVKDSLELGLQTAQESSAGAVAIDGFKATLKQFSQCVEKFGVEEVDPVGQPFDPELHEAMAMQPSQSHEAGTVMTVIQKGYRLHDRLLRPARVIVAQGVDD